MCVVVPRDLGKGDAALSRCIPLARAAKAAACRPETRQASRQRKPGSLALRNWCIPASSLSCASHSAWGLQVISESWFELSPKTCLCRTLPGNKTYYRFTPRVCRDPHLPLKGPCAEPPCTCCPHPRQIAGVQVPFSTLFKVISLNFAVPQNSITSDRASYFYGVRV